MGVSNCEPFASSLEERELLRWAAKAGRGGLCAGNEEHACVCSERFAHALLKASTNPQFLTLPKCSANEQNRTQKKLCQGLTVCSFTFLSAIHTLIFQSFLFSKVSLLRFTLCSIWKLDS